MNATEDFTSQLMRSVMEGIPVGLGSLFQEAVITEGGIESKKRAEPIPVPKVEFDPAGMVVSSQMKMLPRGDGSVKR